MREPAGGGCSLWRNGSPPGGGSPPAPAATTGAAGRGNRKARRNATSRRTRGTGGPADGQPDTTSDTHPDSKQPSADATHG